MTKETKKRKYPGKRELTRMYKIMTKREIQSKYKIGYDKLNELLNLYGVTQRTIGDGVKFGMARRNK